ncbi:MAG: hypothetical protein IJW46_00685 [Clostridia bacterium]|nr:hypothetical protein [Clostridia bacterium]
MKIPDKIKIGGKTYTVEVTDNLMLGRASYTAEVDYFNLKIRILPNAKEKMEADFLHETVHAILDFLGYREHDEKRVDEMAQALYMVIQDNPDIFGGYHRQQWEAVRDVLYEGDKKIQAAFDRVDDIVKTPELKTIMAEMRESVYNTDRETACRIKELLGGAENGTEE